MDRAPHEGFFSVDKVTVWVAARGTDYVDIVDGMAGGIIGRVLGAPGLFSPDGAIAYVNHIRSARYHRREVAESRPPDLRPRGYFLLGHDDECRAQARWVNLGFGLGAANCGYSIGYRCGNQPPEFCYRL